MLAPTPYFSDRGCHVRIYEEARALAELGHEVCIVTYHLGRDMPYKGVRVVRTPPVPWYKKLNAGPSWHKPYLDLLLLWQALLEIPNFRPHLIHAHLHEGALIGSILSRISHLPLLFDYQGSLTGESLNHDFMKPTSLLARIFRGLEAYINRQARHIITSSTAGRLELIHEWAIAPGDVSDLIDGVDITKFRPHPRHEVRQRLGISEDTRLVVYLGLFNRYQGVDLLLEAIQIVQTKAPDIHFLLMGYPDEEYREKAAGMGIGEMITFTGRMDYDQAPYYLSAGDLAVSPKLAKTEANGKLFNYMACGVPTIAFESDINREILGDTGIFVSHGDVTQFAETIVSTIDSGEHCLAALAAQVRQHAVNSHSWLSRSKRLEAIYQKLIQ